jgi:hypothetical protein
MTPDTPEWARVLTYLIQSVGFPVVVAFFVLYKLNGRLGRLADELQQTREALIEFRESYRRGQR